jgi:hypothetical protein
LIDRKIVGSPISSLNEMVRHQNATYHFKKLIPVQKATFKNIWEGLTDKNFDLCPNTRVKLHHLTQEMISIQTYSTADYCALIPNEPKKSFLSFMVSPFDLATWILILLALLIGTTVYLLMNYRRFSHSVRTGFEFLFGIYGIFLGQGSNLFESRSKKNTHFQTFIFFAFLLGTLYQSLIISFIFFNRDVRSIKTFEDLKNSDFKIYTNHNMKTVLAQTETENESFMKRIVVLEALEDSFLRGLNESGAIVSSCYNIDYIQNNFEIIYSNYYKLSEPISSFHRTYVTRRSNPFAETIQKYSLKFFESGISGFLETKFASDLNEKVIRMRVYSESFNDVEIFLNFEDLSGGFIILLIGFVLAGLAFVFEWIWFLAYKKFKSAKI